MGDEQLGPVAQLDRFVSRYQELVQKRLIRDALLTSSLSISASVNEPLQLSFADADEEYLSSFLLVYRQFISQNEPIFVDKIRSLLWRSLDAASARRPALTDAQRRWQHQCRTGTLALNIDGRKFNPELLQDLWINGRYFHNDVRKGADLDRLTGYGAQLARHLFLDQLVTGTNYITYLHDVIVNARSEGVLHVPAESGRRRRPPQAQDSPSGSREEDIESEGSSDR